MVGEPHRAFYGNQFGMTFPLFEHYRVPLWVPEVGGPIDPGNEAHELVMLVFGGMSKGERNRIKIRVRTAMASQAKIEGRFLGGRPPYGYRLADAGPHPNPAKAADGRRLHRLELDPATAPVVARIFDEFLTNRGLFAIAEGLTRDGIPSPSAYDRARNTHRSGVAWAKSAVRAILTNPRYTGHQVWNRQRKDEVLLDVNDVSAGHITKLRWNRQDDWVWSEKAVHPQIVTMEDFMQAQETLKGRGGRPIGIRRRKAGSKPYLLRSMLWCGVCNRRMQGNWANGVAYYRCRFPEEYGLANKVRHPKNVYLREDVLTPQLDTWLSKRFDPEHIEDTLDAFLGTQDQESEELNVVAQIRREIAESDRRMLGYRAALDAGADPAVVARWTREEQARKADAEARLRKAPAAPQPTSRDELRSILVAASKLIRMLAEAEPERRARIYAALGVRLTYHPDCRKVVVESALADNQLHTRASLAYGVD